MTKCRINPAITKKEICLLTNPLAGGIILNIKMKGEKRKIYGKEVANRLNYVIGHLKANLKMVEERRYCIDIIHQNEAVIAALRKVNEIILKNHLETCVTNAIRGKSEGERKRVFGELMEVFKRTR